VRDRFTHHQYSYLTVNKHRDTHIHIWSTKIQPRSMKTTSQIPCPEWSSRDLSRCILSKSCWEETGESRRHSEYQRGARVGDFAFLTHDVEVWLSPEKQIEHCKRCTVTKLTYHLTSTTTTQASILAQWSQLHKMWIFKAMPRNTARNM